MKFGHAQKANFRFGVQKWHSSLDFSFLLSFLPSFFTFLTSFFFFCWAIRRFYFVGKDFRQAFRILELHDGKGSRVVEQDVHGNFQVNVTCFFAFFSSVLRWIVLIVVWFERSLHSVHVSGQSCSWPLKLMTSQAVEGTWIRTGGYGRLEGEWVLIKRKMPSLTYRL